MCVSRVSAFSSVCAGAYFLLQTVSMVAGMDEQNFHHVLVCAKHVPCTHLRASALRISYIAGGSGAQEALACSLEHR